MAIEWLKKMFGQSSSGAGGSEYSPPPGIPAPDQTRKLVLYKFDTCPYCIRVMRKINQLGIEGIEYEDTRRDPSARQRLLQQTGRTQVPCLFIDGVPLFESLDINEWLEAYAARTGQGQEA